MPEGHPTDDELTDTVIRALRDDCERRREGRGEWSPYTYGTIERLCDALLGERAAHTATKAALRELVEASEAFSVTPDVKAIDWDVVGPWILALQSARGVSGEFGESSE